MLSLILSFFCLLALFSCKIISNKQSQNNAQPAYFVGKVVEVYGSGCLLEVTDEGNYGKLTFGTPVQVTTDIKDCPEYVIGDYLKVTFDGTVAESYPPQILHVLGIEKTDSAGNRVK